MWTWMLIQDTAAVAPPAATAWDLAGLAGRLVPIVATLGTSLVLALWRKLSPWFKALSAEVQSAILAVAGVLVAWLAEGVGYVMTGDPATWGPATIQGLVAAVVAHLIYRRGKAS